MPHRRNGNSVDGRATNLYSRDPVPADVPECDYYLTPDPSEWNDEYSDSIYELIDYKAIKNNIYANSNDEEGPPLPPPNNPSIASATSGSDESVNQMCMSSAVTSSPPPTIKPPDLPTTLKPRLILTDASPHSHEPADQIHSEDVASHASYVPMTLPPKPVTTPKPVLFQPASPQSLKSDVEDKDSNSSYVPMQLSDTTIPASSLSNLTLTQPISTSTLQQHPHKPFVPQTDPNTTNSDVPPSFSPPPLPPASSKPMIQQGDTHHSPIVKSKSSSFISYITPPLTPNQSLKPKLFPKSVLPDTPTPPVVPPKNDPLSWTPTSPIIPPGIPVHATSRHVATPAVPEEASTLHQHRQKGRGTSLGNFALEKFSTATNSTIGRSIISKVDQVVGVLKGSSSPKVRTRDAKNEPRSGPTPPPVAHQLPPRPNSERTIKAEEIPIGQKGWIDDEPLYQIYSESLVSSSSEVNENYDEIYEEWPHHDTTLRMATLSTHDGKPVRRPHNRLWKSLPVVQDNLAAAQLTKSQLRLQETKFEIITTEASYINSMNLLQDHFIATLMRDQRLPTGDLEALFIEVRHVHSSSLVFMDDLETCWKRTIFLREIFDVVATHAHHGFHVYVRYCSYQSFMAETYKRLADGNPLFMKAVNELERDPECYQQPLHSFLLLPLQRITRLLLLVEASLTLMTPRHPEFGACSVATLRLKQVRAHMSQF